MNKPKIICDPAVPGTILTEPEHLKSCDVNHMVKQALRGLPVRTKKIATYGDDLMFASKSELLLKKQELQEQIDQIAQKHNITNEEIRKDPVGSILRKTKKAPAPIGADATTPPKADSQTDPQNKNTGDKNETQNEKSQTKI